MNELVDLATNWYALPLGALIFLLTFGFAPSMALRLLVMIYPKGHPRRQELIADLHVLRPVERVLFVGDRLALALTEGLALRYRHWRRIRGAQRHLGREMVRARLHWACLAWDTFEAIAVLAVCVMVSDMLPPGGWLIQNMLWYIALAAVLRYAYVVIAWWVERIVVTDKLILISAGVFGTRVLMMPITKVTDVTYSRSRAGRMLGYGTMIMDSAGEIQPLNRIEYLPRPEQLYDVISQLGFGGKEKR